jgi:hypothetical protein
MLSLEIEVTMHVRRPIHTNKLINRLNMQAGGVGPDKSRTLHVGERRRSRSERTSHHRHQKPPQASIFKTRIQSDIGGRTP